METREKIYFDSLEDITESDLIIDNDDLKNNITFQYVLLHSKTSYVLLHSKTSYTQYYVPIKVKIKFLIEKAKVAINDIGHIKTKIIPITRKHIKRLESIIRLSEETEEFFSIECLGIKEEYELLKTITVLDGYRDERKVAIGSYKKQLHQAKKKLKQFSSNYKTMKKSRLVNCRDTISKLLKDNGIKAHRREAQQLMDWNGVDTPYHL